MVELSQSQEDYLKAIWEMAQSGDDVVRARLAERLGVSPPAVTAALGRLASDGLIENDPEQKIRLTPEGTEYVAHLVLRHNLVEKLLVEVLGLEWYKAHEEAERIEHVISAQVEAKLLQYFGGADGTCPHGSPLTGESAAERRSRGLFLLGEAQVGKTVRVSQIFENDGDLLRHLDAMGVVPGGVMRIEDRSYDEVLKVTIGGNEVHLGRDAALKIWVAPVTGSPASR